MALTQVKTNGIANDAVTSSKIPNDAIGSTELSDDAITSSLIADDAITSALIADDAVVAAAIADDAVVQAAIADDAVDEARLQISNAGSNGQYLSKQSGNTGGLTWASVSSGGLTEADQWRITSDFVGGADPITSNWERNDTGFDKVGTGMSESSGVFTFPSTGIWLVDVRMGARHNADSNMISVYIKYTTNNSSYSNYAAGYGNINPSSGNWYGGANCSAIFDITDTSNQKVSITMSGNDSAIIEGNSGMMISGVTFLKLGDT